ncbi:hypothetical protein HYU96_02590 [Candidatus Daviesbacteria bacterium]|nr:hypothetical protein [Candidatus Daviesbacteria bacterium]
MKYLIIAPILFLILIIFTPVLAQTPACPIQASDPKVQNGLISTSDISGSGGKFGSTTGNCAVDPGKIRFAPFKVPTYDDLKSIYYDQSKTANKQVITSLPTSLTGETLYLVNGDLTADANPGGGGNAIFFVSGNLNFTANYTNGSPNAGTVFVVRGNININNIDATRVNRIDAVLIAQGTICTAFQAGTCPDTNVTAPRLLINGSLINLNAGNPIKFRRTLSNNNEPAEEIVYQPKYLVILRNLFSDTYQKWSEIQ